MQASQLQSLEKTTLLQAQQKNASHAALELADETLEAIHRLRYAVGVNNLFQLSSIRVLPLIYRIGEQFKQTNRRISIADEVTPGASLLPLGSESSTGPLFRAIAVAIDFCLNALIGVCTLAIYLFVGSRIVPPRQVTDDDFCPRRARFGCYCDRESSDKLELSRPCELTTKWRAQQAS